MKKNCKTKRVSNHKDIFLYFKNNVLVVCPKNVSEYKRCMFYLQKFPEKPTCVCCCCYASFLFSLVPICSNTLCACENLANSKQERQVRPHVLRLLVGWRFIRVVLVWPAAMTVQPAGSYCCSLPISRLPKYIFISISYNLLVTYSCLS